MVRWRGAGVLAAGAIALASLPATRAQTPADGPFARHVDRVQLMRDLATLASPAFEGRRTGTPGGLRARQWLVEQFERAGLAPAGTTRFVQPFTFTARPSRGAGSGDAPPGGYEAANVVGRVPGRDPRAPAIVVTAHYDHFGIRGGVLYPGADDNASGVAALLAAARHVARTPPRHPVIVAALDAEELGLRGARALVGSDLLPRGRIALNVNLDMVSRTTANEIYAAGTSYAPWQAPILRDVQRRASVRIRFGHDRPPGTAGGLDDWTRLSDHGAFHEAGIPFVYFGVEDHPDYHKPTDTVDRVDARFFGDVADMIVEALRTFDARLP